MKKISLTKCIFAMAFVFMLSLDMLVVSSFADEISASADSDELSLNKTVNGVAFDIWFDNSFDLTDIFFVLIESNEAGEPGAHAAIGFLDADGKITFKPNVSEGWYLVRESLTGRAAEILEKADDMPIYIKKDGAIVGGTFNSKTLDEALPNIEFEEQPVPLAALEPEEEIITFMDEEVPLGEAPQTDMNDIFAFRIIGFCSSALVIAVLLDTFHKIRKKNKAVLLLSP